MSEYLFLVPIAIAILVGAMSPGPSFVLVSQVAMSTSRTAAITTSLGMGTGAATFALLAAAGLYLVLESVPVFYMALKIAGGMYLCYLAYKIWNNASKLIEKATSPSVTGAHPSEVTSTRNSCRLFLVGFLTQLSNPKTAIVFASIFAAFLPENLPSYSYAFLVLVAFAIDAGWYCVISIVLSTKKAQASYAQYKKVINRTASCFMGVMGLKLIINP
jgi:threonine/homoserine/homoserine lactone efflux protein